MVSKEDKVHLVRVSHADHEKLGEMAKNQSRSIPSELHTIIEKAYNERNKE